MTILEDLLINKETSNQLRDKMSLIFEYWATQINFETELTVENIEIVNQNDQWLKLVAEDKSELEKAKVIFKSINKLNIYLIDVKKLKNKKFIHAVCSPESTEFIEIDSNIKEKTNEIYLNNLTRKYQTDFTIIDNFLVIKGENVNVVKTKNDLNSTNPISTPISNTTISTIKNNNNNKSTLKAASNIIPQNTNNINHNNNKPTLNLGAESINDENFEDEEWVWTMKDLVPDTFNSVNKKVEKKIEEKSNKQNQKLEKFELAEQESDKRFIVIDANNVAIEHGRSVNAGKKYYSCKGIKLAVEHFKNRGHTNIKAIVPRFRRGNSDHQYPSLNPEILDELEASGFIMYVPNKSYDDRFILKAAEHFDGVIVSNDQYRDLQQENAVWKDLVNKNLLQFSFMGDLFMIADDPFGRKGPNIDEFLRKKNPNNNANNIKQTNHNKNHNNTNHHHQQNKNSSGKKRTLSQNATNSTIESNLIDDNNNKTNENDDEEGAVAQAIAEIAASTQNETKNRTEDATNNLFLSLIEIFQNSGDEISNLLILHPTETKLDFFTQKLLN